MRWLSTVAAFIFTNFFFGSRLVFYPFIEVDKNNVATP